MYPMACIADLAEVKGGKRMPANAFLVTTPTSHPYIRGRDIRNGKIAFDQPMYVRDEDFEPIRRYTVNRGDVCITIVGNIGDIGITPPHLHGASLTENAVKLVNLREDIDARFLAFALLAPEAQSQMKQSAAGAAQPKLGIYKVNEIRVAVPPLHVQQRIASILSAYDELIENSQRRIKILEAMARALYREWFVHFRFPGHENHPRVASPLGEIPQGWEVKAIQDFGKVVTGKTPSKANAAYFGEDVQFLKTPDMHGNMFILNTNERLSTSGAASQANKTLPPGSICVSCIGTIGVVSITTEECQTNQQINSVVLANPASREFLFLRLQDAKQALENLGSNGATMGNVNKGKFETMEIVSPPFDLLTRYHQIAIPMFTQILALARQIQNLRRTRDLLLPRLLSGQIEVKAA